MALARCAPIDEAIEVFGRWLILKDPTLLYAVFGADEYRGLV